MLLVVDFQGIALSKLLLGDGEILLELVESKFPFIRAQACSCETTARRAGRIFTIHPKSKHYFSGAWITTN